MQQHGWISKSVCWGKKVHPVGLHVYRILENANWSIAMKSRSLTDYLDQKEEDTKDHKETFGGEGYVH